MTLDDINREITRLSKTYDHKNWRVMMLVGRNQFKWLGSLGPPNLPITNLKPNFFGTLYGIDFVCVNKDDYLEAVAILE